MAARRFHWTCGRTQVTIYNMNSANNTEATVTVAPIATGSRLVLLKGCKARELNKGITVQVISVKPLGADYSHTVQVTFQPLNGFKTNKVFSFYARHENRLVDPVVRMNDGNPGHTIEVRRASPR